MAKKTDVKTEKIEREFVIPLREKCRVVPRYKKTPRAVKTVKEFIAKNMKVYDRDLSKIRVDRFLNEMLWQRGIKKPVHKIKVKAIKEGDIVRVEAVELPANIRFKKLREEKRETKGAEVAKGKKKVKVEEKEEVSEEKKQENKEKEETSKIAEQQIEKELAHEKKHTTETKAKRTEIAHEKKVYNKSSRGH